MTDDNHSSILDLMDLENRFVDAWRSGGLPPSLADFVDKLAGDEYEEALNVLIPIDVQYRFQNGQEPSAGIYASVSQRAMEIAMDLFGDASPVTPAAELATIAGSTDKGEQPRAESDSWDPQISSQAPMNLITDRYRILHKIGQGGMGAVWMAQQEKPMRRRVAIKIIGKSLDSKEALSRFAAERQALAMMDHPNIAKVLDAGYTEDDRPFFAMELVKGIPITQYCNDNRLTVEQRLGLMVSVCEAVQHAHQKGIIHRDLKPSNILVTFHEGQPVPKVIDFGLAKALEHSAKLTDETIVTEFGRVVGTLQYMSPEQANSNELDVDTRTDVYSLGVVLYQLLTDVVPLEKDTLSGRSLIQIIEIIRDLAVVKPSKRLSSDPEHLKEVCENRRTESGKLIGKLEGELDWIVLKALRRDRTDRYQAANALADDLGRFLRDEAVEARPPSKRYLLQKFVRQNSGLVAAFGSIVALMAVSLVIISWLWSTTVAEKEKVEFEKIRSENRLNVFLQAFEKTNKLEGADKNMTANDVLKNAAFLFETNFEEDPIGRAKILQEIGISMRGNGSLEDSCQALRNSHQLFCDHTGVESIETLDSLIEYHKSELELCKETILVLSDNATDQEKNEVVDRIDYRMQTVDKIYSSLTSNPNISKIELADFEKNIGTVYLMAFKELKRISVAKRKYVKVAIRLLGKSYTAFSQLLGVDHEDSLIVYTNFANALLKEGSQANVEKAIQMNKELKSKWNNKALDADENDANRFQIRATKSQNNLAEAFHVQAKLLNDPSLYEIAIKNFSEALEQKIELIGITDRSTFNSIRNLTFCFCDASQFLNAKELLDKTTELINSDTNLRTDKISNALSQIDNIRDKVFNNYDLNKNWQPNDSRNVSTEN